MPPDRNKEDMVTSVENTFLYRMSNWHFDCTFMHTQTYCENYKRITTDINTENIEVNVISRTKFCSIDIILYYDCICLLKLFTFQIIVY